MNAEINVNVIKLLGYFSSLLSAKSGMTHQSNTYEKAALEISKIKKDISLMSLVELDEIPYVGKIIASEVREYCQTGTVKYLERLLSTSNPATVLMLAKGIGKEKANDILETLSIESFRDLLEDYEDGRIAKLLGKDSISYRNISELFEFLPSWVKTKHEAEKKLKDVRPSTDELLHFDDEFRSAHKYVPHKNIVKEKKYNNGLIKVFYSESEKASRLNAEGDWVNIHFDKDNNYLKWVVLTSKYGKMKGKRIVLGEEKASRNYYKKNEN